MPLIRKPGVPKGVGPSAPTGAIPSAKRPGTKRWIWPLARSKPCRDTHGPKALAGFGSAKGSNEEAYLFQKLVRTGFGSNNVDHCTRLCHASSVAALLEGVGSGAVSNPVNDVEHAELIFVIGSNPTANHPVAATWMKNAAKRGAKIVLADPRVTDIGRHAWRTLQFKADTDVAMLNALIHTVIDEGWWMRPSSGSRQQLRGAQGQRDGLQPRGHGARSAASRPRRCARWRGRLRTAKASMILWGMGVSQHVHGTDNARCLIALCAVTGQIGKPGSGLHPLRGQNNVQGASDAGLIPMMFPNYQRVDNAGAHAWFEDFWGRSWTRRPATPWSRSCTRPWRRQRPAQGARHVHHGREPAMSDPDLNHARHALAQPAHLVVQDIFLTETAWLADVVLPASAWPEKTGTASNTDRMVQMGRRALNPPGDARARPVDHSADRGRPTGTSCRRCPRRGYALGGPAAGAGLNWNYEGERIWRRRRERNAPGHARQHRGHHLGPAGARFQRDLPCLTPDDPGQPIVFTDQFPTPTGRLQLVPASVIPAPKSRAPSSRSCSSPAASWSTGTPAA